MQGLGGAKAFQTTVSNAETYMRDAEDPTILYTKTTDAYGRPTSLKRYKLEEYPIEEEKPFDSSNFVTRDELMSTLDSMFKKYLNDDDDEDDYYDDQPEEEYRPPRNKNRNRNRNHKGGVNHEQ